MSLAKYSIYNFAGALAPMVVGLVTVPIYLAQIGMERFGILALCWVMLGQLGFLNLGLGTALAQKLAQDKDTSEERSAMFWTASWLNLAMGIVGALLGLTFAASYFDTVGGLPLEIKSELRSAVPYLAGTVPVAMIVSVLNGALQGREKFLAQNIINSSASVLVSILPLVSSFVLGPRLDYLIASALAGRVVSVAFIYRECVRAVPIRQPVFRPKLVTPLLAFGGWMTIVGMIAPLMVTVDRFVIGSVLGAAAVTIYVVPYQLAERLKVIPQSLVSALFPRFVYSSTRERDRLVDDSVRALTCITTPLAIIAIAAVGPFMHLWVGSQLAVQCSPIAYIMIAAYWSNGFARVPWTLLQAEGRPDLCAKLLVLNLVPYAAMLYFGITTLGVIGAAAAWAGRALLEPVSIFCFTGRQHVLLNLISPAIAVYATMAVALLLPLESALRWALISLLVAFAALAAWRSAPAVMTGMRHHPLVSKWLQS